MARVGPTRISALARAAARGMRCGPGRARAAPAPAKRAKGPRRRLRPARRRAAVHVGPRVARAAAAPSVCPTLPSPTHSTRQRVINKYVAVCTGMLHMYWFVPFCTGWYKNQ
jgi:hypothetical protein